MGVGKGRPMENGDALSGQLQTSVPPLVVSSTLLRWCTAVFSV